MIVRDTAERFASPADIAQSLWMATPEEFAGVFMELDALHQQHQGSTADHLDAFSRALGNRLGVGATKVLRLLVDRADFYAQLASYEAQSK